MKKLLIYLGLLLAVMLIWLAFQPVLSTAGQPEVVQEATPTRPPPQPTKPPPPEERPTPDTGGLPGEVIPEPTVLVLLAGGLAAVAGYVHLRSSRG
ncbi:MAG: hypothetical protein NUW24_10335 [Anaerolineae bacterium]|jgi:hypothetical protein|nr:hypothetical protein [Anaerolineae bacterium]MDH7474038.1 hypothetical protein [Anaerolineae bacterium]